MVHRKKKWDGEHQIKITYFETQEKSPAFGDFWYNAPPEVRFILRVMEMVVWLPYRAFVICYRFAKRFFGASQ